MAKFNLDGQEFARKGDAVAHVRAILNGTPIGGVVTDPALPALLARHPNLDEKTGRGVAAIEVTMNDWGHRCFAVRTDDGDLVIFSFLECFKPSTDIQNAKAALRVEIQPQVLAFRRDSPMVCALTDVALTNERGQSNTAEVDHTPPATFDQLAETWAALQGGWSKVVHHQDGQRRRLTLDAQREAWQAFHQQKATLRLLSARAHRNVGGGQ